MTVRTAIRQVKRRHDLSFAKQKKASAPTARKRQAATQGKLSGNRSGENGNPAQKGADFSNRAG